MSRIFVFALLATGLAGCVHPTHYTVAQRGSDVIALPPHANPTAAESHFEASIKNAPSQPQSPSCCSIASGPITISWHGDTAEVQLNSGQPSAGDALTFFDSQPARVLLQALDNAQSKGCLGADEEYRLKRALTERLPLSTSLARTVLFGSFGLSGYVDLTPDLVLEFISPIYPSGADHIPGNLIGYETADYSFAQVKGDDRIRASLLSVSEQLLGKPAISKAASQNPFPFSPPLNQFRFLLRTAKSSATPLTRAIVLSAAQKTLLDEATAQIQAGLAGFCQAVAVPGVECVVFPSDFAANVKLRVFVNSKQSVVPTYATIGDLIEADSAPKTLVVKRIFGNRLLRVKFDPSPQ